MWKNVNQVTQLHLQVQFSVNMWFGVIGKNLTDHILLKDV